jgi:uncharacterized protein (DUF362 family)
LSAASILRPDIRRHVPFPSANSPPWQLEAVARALQDAGYRELVCTQSNVAPNSAFKGADLNGYLPVLRANHIAIRPAVARAHMCDAPSGANMVLLPTLKTDGATTIGGALSSLAGRSLSAGSAAARELPVDALAAHRERSAGMFVVMDGTTAGNGPGPYRLTPEVRNVLLAAADPVALDAVAAKLMGFDPLRDVEHLRLAHERGLGAGDPRAITLVGDSDLARERWHFSSRGGLPLWERQARGPLGYLLALAAESYRDYYRWPYIERRVFEGWLRGTQWGRLFARYQRLNALGATNPRVSTERKE